MSDLIDIETQFRVMNMELESKTKELLKKADDVVVRFQVGKSSASKYK